MMPNFLIIGAMKAGTTALYTYLEQHPQIYMSPTKEPNFFAFEDEDLYLRWPDDQKGVNRTSVTDIDAYRALFRGASGEKAIGEASHWYLYSPEAPERIRHHIPGVKLIVILRDPVERAYSHFLHSVRTGTERLSDFAQALREEEAGARKPWDFEDYVDRGFYYPQLKRYFDTFDRDQIRLYLYEDLNTDPLGLLRNLHEFLGVDETFVTDVSFRRNVSGIPKSRALDAALRRPHPIRHALKLHLPSGMRRRISKSLANLRTRNLVKPPQLSPEVRKQLKEIYREDTLKLQGLIDRDLSWQLE